MNLKEIQEKREMLEQQLSILDYMLRYEQMKEDLNEDPYDFFRKYEWHDLMNTEEMETMVKFLNGVLNRVISDESTTVLSSI